MFVQVLLGGDQRCFLNGFGIYWIGLDRRLDLGMDQVEYMAYTTLYISLSFLGRKYTKSKAL